MTPEEITASYSRTSQEKDDAFSVDSQVKAARTSADANNLTLPKEYEFREDFSGKALERPELNKLMKLVREKKVCNVIVYAVDRLARKIGVADLLLDEFMEHGVKLWIVQWNSFVKNTPEDRLRFNFEATFSDFERRKIMERTLRGKQDKLSKGIYLGTGRPPYGYIKEGRKREMVLIVCEAQAKIVRLIFHWYVIDGLNVSKIIDLLAGEATPSDVKGYYKNALRGKGNWSHATIYNILRDTTYMGLHTTHGQTIPVPPIVDPELFALAKKKLDDGTFLSPRNTQYQYLMAKRLRCKRCGYAVESSPRWSRGKPRWFYYRCPSWRKEKPKPKCGLFGFRVDVLDCVVWKFIRKLMLNPQALRVMLEESQQTMEKLNGEVKERIVRLDSRLDAERRRFTILTKEYTDSLLLGDGEGAKMVQEVFKQQKEAAAQTVEELSEERLSLVGELQGNSITDEIIESIEEFGDMTEEDLDNLPFEGRRKLVEALGIRGEIEQETEDGQMVQVIYIYLYTHKFRRVLTDSCSSTGRPPGR